METHRRVHRHSPSRRFSFTVGQAVPLLDGKSRKTSLKHYLTPYTVTRIAYMNERNTRLRSTYNKRTTVPRPRLLQYVPHYLRACTHGVTRANEEYVHGIITASLTSRRIIEKSEDWDRSHESKRSSTRLKTHFRICQREISFLINIFPPSQLSARNEAVRSVFYDQTRWCTFGVYLLVYAKMLSVCYKCLKIK